MSRNLLFERLARAAGMTFLDSCRQFAGGA
jgi:hypothetical protein